MSPKGVVAALFLALIGLHFGGSTVVHNVLFDQQNTVSMTRATWKISFYLDFVPYTEAFARLEGNLKQIESALKRAHVQIGNDVDRALKGNFRQLDTETQILLHGLSQERFAFVEAFITLQPKPRSRRSLLPFMGEAFSFLFGAVSENDLKNIKENIQVLSEN